MSNEDVALDQTKYALTLYERIITQWWLPAGLFIFLSGFFWAADRHNHKVITNYALLLPGLLSLLTFQYWRAWLSASRVLPLLFAYMFYMIAISAFRDRGALDVAQWSFYVFLFVFSLSARMAISTRGLIYILAGAAGVAALGGTYAIIADFLNGAFQDPDYRLTGYATLFNQLKSGHLFGAFAVIAICAGIAEKEIRWPCWIIAALCALTVWMTGSRAPSGALLVALIFAILGVRKNNDRHILIAFTILIAIVVTCIFWTKISARGLSLRPEIWQLTIQQALAHPWLGVGQRAEFKIILANGDTIFDPHNVLLAIFYYGGLVGLALFIALFGTAFWTAWKKRHQSHLYLMAALLFLFCFITLQVDGGGVIGRPTLYWVVYWLPIGLALREDYRTSRAQSESLLTSG